MKRAPGVEILLFSIIFLVVMSAVGALNSMSVSSKLPPAVIRVRYFFLFIHAVAYHKFSISEFLSLWELGMEE